MRRLVLGLVLLAGCDIDLGTARYDGAPPDQYPPVDLPPARPRIAVGGVPVDYGPAEESEPAPLPISGGTLLVTADGKSVVASDPDRDRVWVLDVASYAIRGSVELGIGAEPGRVAEDAEGRVHAVLRSAGEVATIDPSRPALIDRRPVCTAPRGITYDVATQDLYVACASGELLAMAAGGGAPRLLQKLDDDLRDVVVEGDKIWVSRFRAAEVIEIVGSRVQRHVLEESSRPTAFGPVTFLPAVAWRMVADPSGGVAVLHQRATTARLTVSTPGGYYQNVAIADCALSVVEGAISRIGGLTNVASRTLGVVLPVDLAITEESSYAVAAPGNAGSEPGLVLFAEPTSAPPPVGGPCAERAEALAPDLEVVAVAAGPKNLLAYQSRLPAGIAIAGWELVRFDAGEKPHLGHALFHRNAGVGTACASCHPEGGEDGRVWRFDTVGRLRTQSLRGGLLVTAPFHWDGAFADVGALMHEVFETRMGGRALESHELAAVARWLDGLPAARVSEPGDPEAIARGRAIFRDERVDCARCHAGAALTNNDTLDVGTDGAFQVPSLRGLASRAPYLHDGRAKTLRDRFSPAGGGERHGHTAHLTPAELDDLIAYLESL